MMIFNFFITIIFIQKDVLSVQQCYKQFIHYFCRLTLNMSDNPFANPEADRYFQEPPKPTPAPAPAPQTTTSSSPPTSTNQVLDDYNPFAGQPQQTTPAAPTFVQSDPVVIPSNQPSKNGSANVDTQELQRRQEELERKAAELMRKEQELKNMQMGGKCFAIRKIDGHHSKTKYKLNYKDIEVQTGHLCLHFCHVNLVSTWTLNQR